MLLAACTEVALPEVRSAAASELVVYFFDVDQGDATLLAGPDFTILIDAGRHDRTDVVPYLRAAGVQAIDLLVGTHPHADHIGQFPAVLEKYPVAEVWLSGDSHTTRTFERALDAILDSGASYHEPRAGEVYRVGSALVEVVNPDRLTGNLHEGSLALRVVFGNVAFLFTGDAEAETEAAMIARTHPLRAQILQLGHHGSHTSSTLAFLQAVNPEVAVYSAGRNNPYGHPHTEVVERLKGLGVHIYGTDTDGTIRVVTNGATFQVEVTGGQ
jgi:competence protein ComEC